MGKVKEKNSLIKKISIFCLGLGIIQVGVSLSLVLDIGSDCFTVFTQGLSIVLNTTPGYANMLILFIYVCAIIFLNRKYIKIGTFICLIGIGPLIDLLIGIFSALHINEANILIKCLIMILATFIIGIGFSMVSSTKLGMAPHDIIVFLVVDKFNIQYKWSRMSLDFLYLIVGFIIGGTVGIGTVISALLVGPCIQFCIPYGERLFMKNSNNQFEQVESKNLSEAV